MTALHGESLAQWLFGRQRLGVKPGLERVAALLAALGHPERSFKVILVGGTNGKGSTAATLAAILSEAGYRTGLFTSPHLIRFSERFVIDGRECGDDEVWTTLAELRPLAEELGATFFEVVTALGCLLFARAQVEWAVFEVGLGGRLDATNALDPELSVVTTVSLDHTEILGETVQAIAAEKAGILRRGRPAVTGVERNLWPVLEASQASLWAEGREFSVDLLQSSWSGTTFGLRCQGGLELQLHTPLLGAHAAHNAALAAVAALRLRIAPQAIAAGVGVTKWVGRLERVEAAGQTFVLDGAHNPAGAYALAHALQALGTEQATLVFGAAGDKDLPGVVEALAPLAREVILTRAVLSPRAAERETLEAVWTEKARGVKQRWADTPAQAIALAAGELPPVVVCGSLYLIGEVRAELLGYGAEHHERWQ